MPVRVATLAAARRLRLPAAMVESPPRGGAGHETWRDELERAARAPRSAVTVVRRAGVLRLQVGSWDFESELRYDPPIRCRFDLACQALRLAVEVDGGRWASGGGRHGGDRDYQKLRRAALLGWSVLRWTTAEVRRDPAAVLRELGQQCVARAARVERRLT